LSAVLTAAGSSINSVVKVAVFLADMKDFADMNEVYEQVLVLLNTELICRVLEIQSLQGLALP
jgi:enamine deaminase RidA (YjgF/YER057c/UK114 family)